MCVNLTRNTKPTVTKRTIPHSEKIGDEPYLMHKHASTFQKNKFATGYLKSCE